MSETETIDRLFLELSQFSAATTARELKLEEAVALLNSMVESGERHSERSRKLVAEAMKRRTRESA